MVRRNGRINRRRTGRPFNRRRNRNNQKVDFTGIRAQPPRTPRTAQDAPWNTIVVQRTFTVADSTAFSVTVAYLRDILANQLNSSSDDTLTFRVISADLYDLGGRPMEISSYNYTAGSTSAINKQLNTALSWPDRNGWSRAKIIWPKAISAIPLSFTGALNNIVLAGGVGVPIGITSVASDKVLLRVKFLWRVTQANTVPAVSLVFNDEPVHELQGCSKTLRSLAQSDLTIEDKINSTKMQELGIHMDSNI